VPPFAGVRLRDAESLRCTLPDGAEPYLLHHFARKPWLEPMYHGIYSRALVRSLLAPDVAIRVPAGLLPRRMRGGVRGRADRAAVNARDLGRFYFGDALPSWLGTRVEARRRRGGRGS
jgi:hypothetical protein